MWSGSGKIRKKFDGPNTECMKPCRPRNWIGKVPKFQNSKDPGEGGRRIRLISQSEVNARRIAASSLSNDNYFFLAATSLSASIEAAVASCSFHLQ